MIDSDDSAEELRALAAEMAVAIRARRKKVANFRDMKTEWRPGTVRNPALFGTPFTEGAAWDLIAEKLEGGQPIRKVSLREPPGASGYEMCINLDANMPDVYVKLMFVSGTVIARSFHYSDR